MSEDERVRENRLRRKAGRMGYILMKSRARDPDALTYGGYQVVDPETRGLIAGWGNAGRGYALDMDDVEAWLADGDDDLARADPIAAALLPDPQLDATMAAPTVAQDRLLAQAEKLMIRLGYTKQSDGSFKAPSSR